jgi:hypothetical protein
LPSTEEIAAELKGQPHAALARGQLLVRLVHDHSIRHILVLGSQPSTCYLAGALEGDDGHVVSIVPATAISESPSLEQHLERLALSRRATIFYEYDGYTWRLGQLLAQRPRPQFDLVLIDGRHSWDTDGFAFLLSEQLLTPGGYVAFAALSWTIAGSPTLAAQTQHVPEEIRDAQHVRLVCQQLVKPHPNISEYWEDSHWAFARKRTRGDQLDDDAREAALAVMREQAAAVRRRADRAARADEPEALVAVHRLTGGRATPSQGTRD